MKKARLQYPTIAEASVNSAQRLANIIGSCFPVIGPAVYEMLAGTTANMQEERIRACFEQVADTLQSMPETILASEDFADATWTILKKIASESNKNKRNRLAQLYEQFMKRLKIAPESSPLEEFQFLSDITASLTDRAFTILLYIHEFSERHSTIQHEEKEWITCALAIQKAVPQHWIDRCLKDLVNAGLIDTYRPSSYVTKSRMYLTMPLATILFNWLSMGSGK